MTKRSKTRKKNRRPKKRGIMRRIFLVITVFFVAAAAVLAVYMLCLSHRIDQRFAGRRWDIPSRVYSDTTLLYAGQRINRTLLLEKLERLGYRETAYSPERQGDMRISHDEILLYRHEFHSPTYTQESMKVRIALENNRVVRITDPETKKAIALLELEPEELMLYFGPDRERRRLLSVRKLPPHAVHAVLAAEDHDFYNHQGFVLKGYLRAVLANLRSGGIRQGGSTITLQLARNYFLTLEQTYRRKIHELLIAIVLEFKFSKTDILEMYLNEVYWGQRGSVPIHGLAEAARYYFDKEAAELSVAEAATLAGILRSPNRYSPLKHPEASMRTRNTVITAMRDEGWLKEDAFEKALSEPLNPTGYDALRGRRAPYFMDYLTDQLTELYSRETLTTEGLSIHTTIDTQVQSAAETALERGLSRLESANPKLMRENAENRLQGAVIVMQPKTGYIIAMVGGRNYGESQYNRATTLRQPGSAFKPFVFLSALDTHTPASMLSNTPRTFSIDGKPWEPKNFEKNTPETVTLRDALAESQNIATVNLAFADSFATSRDAADVNLASAPGLKRMVDIAEAFHLYDSGPFYPSMALGAKEVSPLMLARAYCTFAADGVLPIPLSIKDVVNESGEVIERRLAQIERLITPAKAYMICDLMRSVVETGTGRSLGFEGIDWPVAGKTGTTNDSRDAWFVGYTPDILALVWVGFDNCESIQATGARAALPIWADLMNALPQYVSGEWFAVPPGIEKRTICRDSGLLADAGHCPDTTEELFLSGTEPTETCNTHGASTPLSHILKGVKKIVPGL